jgi:hypothetical protein
MSTPRTMGDIALELAGVKAIKEHLTTLWENLRDEAGSHLEPGDKKAAKLPDGSTGASILKTDPKPSTSWKVTDETAFLAWVKEHRPTAIVEQVRSSDTTSILAGIATSGEVPDGVEEVTTHGRPTVSVTQTPAQRQAVIDAWRTGVIVLPDPVKEIES